MVRLPAIKKEEKRQSNTEKMFFSGQREREIFSDHTKHRRHNKNCISLGGTICVIIRLGGEHCSKQVAAIFGSGFAPSAAAQSGRASGERGR
jgi:hypothetical protein